MHSSDITLILSIFCNLQLIILLLHIWTLTFYLHLLRISGLAGFFTDRICSPNLSLCLIVDNGSDHTVKIYSILSSTCWSFKLWVFLQGHENKTMTQIKRVVVYIDVRENRRNNQQWTIQTLRQCWTFKILDEDKQNTTQKTKKDEQDGSTYDPRMIPDPPEE